MANLPAPLPSWALMGTSPIPLFIAPNLVPPQQHCDGVFYGGVDSIQATASELQAAVRCLLARQQGQRPIFKRRRPIVPAATILQQLAERKAIARATACKVSQQCGCRLRHAAS